ncbi:MAG: beta-propeller fold lactonase family protein, partial [Chthonomonadales bacterium]
MIKSASMTPPTIGLVAQFAGLLAFAAGSQLAMAQTPSFLYSANGQSNDVSAYQINSPTGTLTTVPGSPFLSGVIAHGVASDPKGRFLFVVNSLVNTLSVFAISPSTGSLVAVPGSPFAIGSGGHGVIVHPNGLFLYVENSNNNTIAGFAINQTTGALTPVGGSPFGGGGLNFSLFNLQIDPTGTFLYV